MTHFAAATEQRSLLSRADVILGAFDEHHPTLSMQGLAARTGIPRTSVRRTVEKLVELDWLQRRDDRYAVGPRLTRLARLAGGHPELKAATRRHLVELHAATRLAVHLAVPGRRQALIVDQVTGLPAPGVGAAVPGHCTAAGKVLAAHTGYVPGPMVGRTRATITDPRRLRRELDGVRSDGVGFDREEYLDGRVCVAAPVRGSGGTCVAAVSVTGPAGRVAPAQLAWTVQRAAQHMSRALTAYHPALAS